MRTLHCDICRKELVNPISERTYWHIREYDVCEACKVRRHFPYSQDWYEHEFMAIVEKGVASRRP